jgi:hypothetical protein
MNIYLIEKWSDFPYEATFRTFTHIDNREILEDLIKKVPESDCVYYCENAKIAYFKVKEKDENVLFNLG